MGFESMVTVQAEVGDIDKIVEAAKVLLELMLEEPEEIHIPAQVFLERVIDGSCIQGGNKGDVLLWGGIWNYFREEEFTPWVARLMDATQNEWNTNLHISWEHEQSASREVKVFWFSCRGGKLLWADIPEGIRMHWGVCDDSGPHVGDQYAKELILDIDGKKYPDHDTCRHCRTIISDGFQWVGHNEGFWRRCPACGDERRALKVHIWKDED